MVDATLCVVVGLIVFTFGLLIWKMVCKDTSKSPRRRPTSDDYIRLVHTQDTPEKLSDASECVYTYGLCGGCSGNACYGVQEGSLTSGDATTCSPTMIQPCACASCGANVIPPGDPSLDCIYDSSWSPWSDCTANCSNGTCTTNPGSQFRTRGVLRGPLPGGQPCDDVVEVQPCWPENCAQPVNCVAGPADGAWIGCPACIEAGMDLNQYVGVQYRTVATIASNGGADCSYDQLYNVMTCTDLLNLGLIQVNSCTECQYGPVMGTYSECLAPCGPLAVQYAVRTISSGDQVTCFADSIVAVPCPGILSACPTDGTCTEDPTNDMVTAQCNYLCTYGDPYNPKTADGPVTSRKFGPTICPVTLDLTNPVCPYDPTTQRASCTAPVDCEYTPWSEFSACDSICSDEPGTKVRTRGILRASSFGGAPCNPNLMIDYEQCAVDTAFDQFNSWAPAWPTGYFSPSISNVPLGSFGTDFDDPSILAMTISEYAAALCIGYGPQCTGVTAIPGSGGSLSFVVQTLSGISGPKKLLIQSLTVLSQNKTYIVAEPSWTGACGLTSEGLNVPVYLDASSSLQTGDTSSMTTYIGVNPNYNTDTYDDSLAIVYFSVCQDSLGPPDRIDDWVYTNLDVSKFPITTWNRNCANAVDCSLSAWVDSTACPSCGPPFYKWQSRTPIHEATNGGRPCADFVLRQSISCGSIPDCSTPEPCLYGEWPSTQPSGPGPCAALTVSQLYENAWSPSYKYTWLNGGANFETLVMQSPSINEPIGPEVFVVGGTGKTQWYPFTNQSDAEAGCATFGARLASLSDLETGYSDGLQVCSNGWYADDSSMQAIVMQEVHPGCGGIGVGTWSSTNSAAAWCYGMKPLLYQNTTVTSGGLQLTAADFYSTFEATKPSRYRQAYAPSTRVTGPLASDLNSQLTNGNWVRFMSSVSGFYYTPTRGWAPFNQELDDNNSIGVFGLPTTTPSYADDACTGSLSNGLINFTGFTSPSNVLGTICTCPSLCPVEMSYCSWASAGSVGGCTGTCSGAGTEWMMRPIQAEPINGGTACDITQQIYEVPCTGPPCPPVCPVGCNGLPCSGKGTCVNGKCVCDDPSIVGAACEEPCPTDGYGQICGGHGTCGPQTNFECECEAGFSGFTCEVFKQAFLVNDGIPEACARQPDGSVGTCNLCADSTIQIKQCNGPGGPFGGYGLFNPDGSPTCGCTPEEMSLLATPVASGMYNGLALSYADLIQGLLQGSTVTESLRWFLGAESNPALQNISDECMICVGNQWPSTLSTRRWFLYIDGSGASIGPGGDATSLSGYIGCNTVNSNGALNSSPWNLVETPIVQYPDVIGGGENPLYWRYYYLQTDDPNDVRCMTNWKIQDNNSGAIVDPKDHGSGRITNYFGQKNWCMRSMYLTDPGSGEGTLWESCNPAVDIKTIGPEVSTNCASCIEPAPAPTLADCNLDTYTGYYVNPLEPDYISLYPYAAGPASYIGTKLFPLNSPNVVQVDGSDCADLGYNVSAAPVVGSFGALKTLGFWPVGYRA